MSQAYTQCFSISGGDVRDVMVKMRKEVSAVCAVAGQHIHIHFESSKALADVAIMALNDLLSSVHLQFETSGVLVCEYVYIIATQQLTATGPEPENPPLPYDFSRFPPGTKCRFYVKKSPEADTAQFDSMLATLGWKPAGDLADPSDIDENSYGTFVSGGYGVVRTHRGSRQYRI